MSILSQLASSLGHRGEKPNEKLAGEIVKKKDEKAILELIDHLKDHDKNIQSDCIKVLYEVGERDPKLIAEHLKSFLKLLSSKHKRMIWGAITALDTITFEKPEQIFDSLSMILDAANQGSVIAMDHTVGILTKLSTIKKYRTEVFQLLLPILRDCPTNQLPMYAERVLPTLNKDEKPIFAVTVLQRMQEIDKESKRKRLEKVLKKMDKD